MEDKTTPHLKPERQQAVLSGSDFLTGREAYLQARLDELEAELVSLGDVPDDVESLERQAGDALRSLMDLLEPPTPVPTPTLLPEKVQPVTSAAQTRPRRSEAGRHHRFRWSAGIVAVLLAAVLAAILLVWMYGPDGVRDSSPATVVVRAAATHTSIPPTPTIARPTRPPAAATPILLPTVVAPVIPETPGWLRESAQAETVQILDISGTLRLELPLTLMADTVRMVEGMPVLQPALPAGGAGLHRGSAPFGELGRVIVAVPKEAAPENLWQTRQATG
jgi:hypothetical protein